MPQKSWQNGRFEGQKKECDGSTPTEAFPGVHCQGRVCRTGLLSLRHFCDSCWLFLAYFLEMVGDDGGDVLLTCSHVGSWDFLQIYMIYSYIHIAQPQKNHQELYRNLLGMIQSSRKNQSRLQTEAVKDFLVVYSHGYRWMGPSKSSIGVGATAPGEQLQDIGKKYSKRLEPLNLAHFKGLKSSSSWSPYKLLKVKWQSQSLAVRLSIWLWQT